MNNRLRNRFCLPSIMLGLLLSGFAGAGRFLIRLLSFPLVLLFAGIALFQAGFVRLFASLFLRLLLGFCRLLGRVHLLRLFPGTLFVLLLAVRFFGLGVLGFALIARFALLLVRFLSLTRVGLGFVGALSGLLAIGLLFPGAFLVLLILALTGFAIRFLPGFAV